MLKLQLSCVGDQRLPKTCWWGILIASAINRIEHILQQCLDCASNIKEKQSFL